MTRFLSLVHGVFLGRLLGQSFYGWSLPVHRSVPFGARPPVAAERDLGLGQEIGRANGRSRSLVLRHHAATISLDDVFSPLGHDFGTENRALSTLFTTLAKPCHGLFTFFLLNHLNDLGP